MRLALRNQRHGHEFLHWLGHHLPHHPKITRQLWPQKSLRILLGYQFLYAVGDLGPTGPLRKTARPNFQNPPGFAVPGKRDGHARPSTHRVHILPRAIPRRISKLGGHDPVGRRRRSSNGVNILLDENRLQLEVDRRVGDCDERRWYRTYMRIAARVAAMALRNKVVQKMR